MGANEILKSDVWLNVVRPVANFYEFIGLLVHKRYIDASVAFALVTPDVESRENAAPIIDALRQKYRKDLYLFWDELIRLGKNVEPLIPIHIQSEAAVRGAGR